jgi:hypothetical protein
LLCVLVVGLESGSNKIKLNMNKNKIILRIIDSYSSISLLKRWVYKYSISDINDVQKAGYLDVRFQAEKRFAKKQVIKML